MSLTNTIQKISNDWSDYRKYCIKKNTKGTEIKVVKSDHNFYDLVITNWKEEVAKIVNSKKYLVKSSLGEGNLVAGPWLAVMNKSITNSARRGFYIVYLFSRSTKKIYLTIGIGSYQFELEYGKNNRCLEQITEASEKFRKSFNNLKPKNSISKIDILEDDYTEEKPLEGSPRFLMSSYQLGTCFAKEYNSNILDEDILKADLKEFLNSYEKIVLDPQSDNLDIMVESTLEPKKPNNFNYVIEDFIPVKTTERKKKNKEKKISIVKKSKQKRRTQESKKIGEAGEKYVYEYEYNKLVKANRIDLAKKIDKHCERYDYPGWDITSYDLNGKEIYIEIKSTKGEVINDLDITDNEWEAAKTRGSNYHIYLVNNVFKENVKIFKRIQNPALQVSKKKILLSTAVWNLKLN
tara:strand:- start:51 stop:1271 length:1221 start_codon:yes stop_codon:yes gene_type:complete